MKSAYSLANQEILEIRNKNKAEQRRREDEVREKMPEFSQVEKQLASGGLALARCVLEGTNNVASIRAYIEEAQNKKKNILKKLNLPLDYLDEIYSCKLCRDTGFDENGRRCECLKKMISKYVGVNSNLTESMKEQTFENFDFSLFETQPDVKGKAVLDFAKKSFDMARKFADTFDETHANLFIYGKAGTGKTYLSSCIVNRALSRGFSVYYQSAFSLLDMCEKLKFGRYDEEEAQEADYAIKYAYNVDLLVIDDLGTEFISGYSSAALFDIINSRLVSKKSTVISSNLDTDKINNEYGARLASRISGDYKQIPFPGIDLRNKKR